MDYKNLDGIIEKTIVVFGGAGFIGTHLISKLVSSGAKKVISVDLQQPKRPVEKVDYHTCDVRDLGDLNFEGVSPIIFNLAAVHTTPGHEPHEYYDTNVNGAIQVVQFALRHRALEIIFASSISVYGPDETPKDESTQPSPISNYGRSKLMAELIHMDWQKGGTDRRLVIVRPAVVFGLGEGGNFTRLAKMLSRGFFLYPGRKDTIKSCIYVGDLVDWILEATRRGGPLTLFNGAYSERYTIQEIVETFQKIAYPKSRTFLVPASVLSLIAMVLRPFSATGLGIHPERIKKLMVSTNVLPTWAETAGLPTRNRLEAALRAWHSQGKGNFS